MVFILHVVFGSSTMVFDQTLGFPGEGPGAAMRPSQRPPAVFLQHGGRAGPQMEPVNVLPIEGALDEKGEWAVQRNFGEGCEGLARAPCGPWLQPWNYLDFAQDTVF